MRPRTQTTRTNHLGYDVGCSSRKIPDGALARAATAECRKANQSNVFTRFALMLFRLLCFGFGVAKAALKAAAAAFSTRPTDRGGSPTQLTPEMVEAADVVVTLGREAHVEGAHVENWDTDEPSERGIEGIERMRLVRDDIAARVAGLAGRLA